MKRQANITIYGTARCHKSQFYIRYFEQLGIPFVFLDVEEDEVYERELRSLYDSGKLNFPTIIIKDKKLRNPTVSDLEEWLIKKEIMIRTELNKLNHKIEKRQFHLDLDGGLGIVRYEKKENSYFLIHAEVPYEMRGNGYGKILVEKTFDYIAEEGSKAVAICPYIKVVAGRNPKWHWVD